MIKELHVTNFKSIDEIGIPFKRVNLLVGKNSSGKSTIIQSLLLVYQNEERFIGLNDEYVSLGGFDDARCRYVVKKDISIKLRSENGDEISHVYFRDGESGKLQLNKNNNRTFSPVINYLSCHRVGPLTMYRKDMTVNDRVGINGEYAVAYLNRHREEPLENELCKNRSNMTLMGQVNHWLKFIAEAEINTSDITGTDYVRASYNVNSLTELRPSNIGAGISYLVSVIIMCLASEKGSFLIVENPEIHLHPSAQAKLCEFFYFIGESGRQILIETHSDHVFNGFRAGVVSQSMDSEKLNVLFTYTEEDLVTKVMEVKIGRYGRIENQRKDLFDQFDIDMRRMVGV